MRALDSVFEEIRNMVAEIVEMEPEEISADAKFVEDLGVDSMMALEILASLEKKYRVRIPEESLTKLTNLNQTVALTKEMLAKQSANV
ncbi:MAG: acyl carrier protein [Candidatus Omnitrophota bacterium]